MLKILIRFSAFFILALPIVSCQEEEEFNASPEIRILNPSGEVSIAIPDTVNVSAEISDKDSVHRITLTLLNSSKQPVSGSVLFTPGVVNYKLDYAFPISDTSLTSGNYFIRISASDGKKDFARNISLKVQAVPRVLTGFVFIRQKNQWFSVEKYSTNLELVKKRSFQDEYYSSVYQTNKKFLFVSAKKHIPLVAIKLDELSISWQEQISSSFDYHIKDEMRIYRDRLYIAYAGENRLVIYNFSGNPVNEITLEQRFMPGKLALSDDYIFLERIKYGQTGRKLGVYFYQTAAHSESYDLPYTDLLTLTSLNTDSLALTVKHHNRFKLSIFNHKKHFFSDLIRLDGKPFRTVLIEPGLLLIGTDTKLYRYHLEENRNQELFTGEVSAFRYDPTKDVVYVLTPSKLLLIEATLGTLVNSFTLQEEITDFHLIYNR